MLPLLLCLSSHLVQVSTRVLQPIISKVGISYSVGAILNLQYAHLVVVVLVVERKVERALIPGAVYKIIAILRQVFQCSLRS
jgi:hypothetical protein